MPLAATSFEQLLPGCACANLVQPFAMLLACVRDGGVAACVGECGAAVAVIEGRVTKDDGSDVRDEAWFRVFVAV